MNWAAILGAAGIGAITVKVLDIIWLQRVTYEYQRHNWLRDQRLQAYSALSKELVSFGLHLDKPKSPFESFEVASNAMLLINNGELIEKIDQFIIKVDKLNGLLRLDTATDEDLIEANIIYAELIRDSRGIVGELRRDLIESNDDVTHIKRYFSKAWQKIRNLTTQSR